ncbi:MAG TPA: tetratricopeptide repeat protein [Ignavibacteriales bacterium]|nr:tetratricopeptide repeat protein [Ignavibacteriales bacterium]
MNRYFVLLCSVIITAILLTGCSKKSEQELFNAGQKDVQEGKYTEAVDAYETLVKDYPQSPRAPKVLFEIGKLYEGKTVKNVPETESLKKAVEYYSRIFKEYPKSAEASTALFMAGFIQANYLKDFNAATASFKQFLSSYPNHEMSPSAQAELDNMGLSPDEILKKKLEAKK